MICKVGCFWDQTQSHLQKDKGAGSSLYGCSELFKGGKCEKRWAAASKKKKKSSQPYILFWCSSLLVTEIRHTPDEVPFWVDDCLVGRAPRGELGKLIIKGFYFYNACSLSCSIVISPALHNCHSLCSADPFVWHYSATGAPGHVFRPVCLLLWELCQGHPDTGTVH